MFITVFSIPIVTLLFFKTWVYSLFFSFLLLWWWVKLWILNFLNCWLLRFFLIVSTVSSSFVSLCCSLCLVSHDCRYSFTLFFFFFVGLYMPFFVIDNIDEGVEIIMLKVGVVMGTLSTILFHDGRYVVHSTGLVCLLSLDWLDKDEESLSLLIVWVMPALLVWLFVHTPKWYLFFCQNLLLV